MRVFCRVAQETESQKKVDRLSPYE